MSAWGLGNTIVGLLPSLILKSFDVHTLIGASSSAIVLAGLGIIGQYSVPAARARLGVFAAGLTLLSGALLISIALQTGIFLLTLLGAACIGFGQGAGYRVGMRVVSHQLPPRLHGSRTSLYACLAYGSATVLVLGGGQLMGIVGDEDGLTLTVGLTIPLLLAIIIATLVNRPRPRTHSGATLR